MNAIDKNILRSQQHRPGGDGGAVVVFCFLAVLLIFALLFIQVGIWHGRNLAEKEIKAEKDYYLTTISALRNQTEDLSARNAELERERIEDVALLKRKRGLQIGHLMRRKVAETGE